MTETICLKGLYILYSCNTIYPETLKLGMKNEKSQNGGRKKQPHRETQRAAEHKQEKHCKFFWNSKNKLHVQ